ncbi:MAG: glycoside hydrolase family 3 C-terminal domain-containing protein, partial [Lachnospiraceae bacterium]|nr:glycoside hydrolase family 3 C-terminal domain-containing protein [Lachnospiraceae bacterium]
MMTNEQLSALIDELTIDEKIAMVHGATLFYTTPVERLGIPQFCFSDGPMGVRPEYQSSDWYLKGFTDDYVSYCMSNSALASTFNRSLAEEAGEIIGEETRGRKKDMILGPGINIQRTPICGRNFEYMSEDPYVSGEMAEYYIKGVQKHDVSACVKHYALNNQEEERNIVDTYVSRRALMEIYLPGFRKAVKQGKALGIMGSYNKFEGTYCSHHPYLIDEILRKSWGFDKLMVSDWGSIHDTTEAGNAGIDVDMRVTNDFDDYPFADPLKEAVASGAVSMEALNEKIAHILTTMDALHMFDYKKLAKVNPIFAPLGEDENGKKIKRKHGRYNATSSGKKLLKAAEESIVLLKNEAGLLPLKQKKIKKFVIIGDNANRQHALGGGSAEIKALYEITPLLGIKMLLGGNTEVVYEPGYYNYVIGNAWGHDANGQGGGLNPFHQPTQNEIDILNQRYLASAKKACKDADAVLFIGGLNHDHDVEGADRKSMTLPEDQDEIIEELLNVRPDMMVAMMAGSPVDMHKWADRVKTLLYFSYNGMQGGMALARVLFGKVNPSGKMPYTLPKVLGDAPAHKLGEYPGTDKTVHYNEDIFVGYRYYDAFQVDPLFAFGHGESYTDFTFGDLTLTKTACEKNDIDGDISVTVTVP